MNDASRQRMRQVEHLFHQAVDLEPSMQADFVRHHCGGDEALRDELMSLLRVHQQSGHQLQSLHFDDCDCSMDGAVPPQRIGAYTIVRLIARGGMGSVYEANQEHPKRRVAIKVLRRWLVAPGLLRRFGYESQALAQLQHPNIAQVLEAGTFHDAHDGTQPFFVMEFIEGEPITEYAQRCGLSQRKRIELFFQVIDAVQFAHEKGLIHRDLKPPNILVNGRGLVKVIDFGIAQTIESDPTIATMHTEAGQLLGTLQYMSPEQCDGHPHAVDVRSDVYSLGLILYELLYQRRPYEVSDTTIIRAARIISEQAPTHPSSVNRRWRGDLETIVLKTLEKEPARRYRTAESLRQDLVRFLNNLPITAKPASAWDRSVKFVRRNRAATAAGAMALITLVAATIVSASMAIGEHRARTEAERQTLIAQVVNEFLTNDLLAAADPNNSASRDITMREVLDSASERVEGRFEKEPVVEAAIRMTIGSTYVSLYVLDRAEVHLRRALDLRRQFLGTDHVQTLQTWHVLATLISEQGHNVQAKQELEAILERARRVLSNDHDETLAVLETIGQVHLRLGEFEHAESAYREAAASRVRLLGQDNPAAHKAFASLALVYLRKGEFKEAEQHCRQALENQRRLLGEDHPDTLMSSNHLGVVYWRQGRYDEAEAIYNDTIERRRRVLGDEHSDTLVTRQNLALLYRYQKRYEDAERILKDVHAIQQRVHGEEHPQTLISLDNLGTVYYFQKNYDAAEPIYRRVLEVRRRTLGEDHAETLVTMNNVGNILRDCGSLDESAALFADLLARARQSLPATHTYLPVFLSNYARTLLAQENMEQAEALLLETMELNLKHAGESHPRTIGTMRTIVTLYEKWNRPDKAELYRARIDASVRQDAQAAR